MSEQMLEMPGKMQVTLVSYYGKKPDELSDLIRSCQDQLALNLRSAFRPYQPEQVHGTIVGHEGYRVGEKVRNQNSVEAGHQSDMDPSALLKFLRTQFPSFNVRIGNYRLVVSRGLTNASSGVLIPLCFIRTR